MRAKATLSPLLYARQLQFSKPDIVAKLEAARIEVVLRDLEDAASVHEVFQILHPVEVVVSTVAGWFSLTIHQLLH